MGIIQVQGASTWVCHRVASLDQYCSSYSSLIYLHLSVTPLRTYMLMIPPLVMPRTIRLCHKMSMMVSSRTCMDMIKEWSDNNKMILNETKTKTMLICGKRLGKKLSDRQLQVQVNHTELEQVHTHTLLGVKIDDKLSFNEHIEDLCKTLSQRIAVLKKIKSFLPLEQRILYYNVMIKQIMLYGSIAWSSCSIQNLQKEASCQSYP